MLINQARALQLMKRERVDAFVGTSIENNYYFAGLWAISSAIFPRDSQVYVIVTADNLESPSIVIPTSDADCTFECFCLISNVYPYGTFYRELNNKSTLGEYEGQYKKWAIDNTPYSDAITALCEAISKSGLSESCVAIDEKAFRADYFPVLAEKFPKGRFIPGAKLIQEIRAIKTPEEINRLRRVCQITEQAINVAVSIIKEGVTEKDVVIAFRSSLVSQGAMPAFECINFGTNTGFGNLYSSDQVIIRGQHIRFDVGCRYQGYVSDLSRIFAYGTPNERVRTVYKALCLGNQAGIESLYPGKKAFEIFNTVVETVHRAGIPNYRRTHTGHGIGVEFYQPPLIAPNNLETIHSGMIFAIETPYYELGFGGLQIEDMVVVTPHGAEYLSTSTRDLVEIG
jgi:Xaa-Pro dipeptidase